MSSAACEQRQTRRRRSRPRRPGASLPSSPAPLCSTTTSSITSWSSSAAAASSALTRLTIDGDRRLVRGDLVADRHVAQHDVGDLRRSELRELRDVQLEHEPAPLTAVRVADLHLHARPARRPSGTRSSTPRSSTSSRRADLDADVLRDERRQSVELLGEDPGRVVRGLGEVGRAARRVGDRGEQVLVEAVTEADRRGRRLRLACPPRARRAARGR